MNSLILLRMFVIPFSVLSPKDLQHFADEMRLQTEPEWVFRIGKFLGDWLDEELPEITLFTSGSTGAPKAIRHRKSAMLESARLTCQALGLCSGDNALLCLPAHKIGGMMMIVRSYFLKMDLYCVKPSIHAFQDIPQKNNFQFAAFTSMQANALIGEEKAKQRFQQIDHILLGGENVSDELQQQLHSLKNKVYATFGMTETISHIALKRLSGHQPDKHYRTLPEVHINTGENDCLIIDAPLLGVHQLRTNDVVEIIGPNEFDWKGRLDNVINTGGIKLNAEQIERKLYPYMRYPYFIAATPDVLSGEAPALVLEAEQLTSEEIQIIDKVIAQLPKIERPKSVLTVSQFLKTETGKIKRKETMKLANVKTQQDS